MRTMSADVVSKLVFMPTATVVAEWTRNEIRFHDLTLKNIMQSRGIDIPQNRRPDFGGRTVILSSDPNSELFIKAFRELYYPYSYPKNEYSLA